MSDFSDAMDDLAGALGEDVVYSSQEISAETIRAIFSNGWNRVEGPRGPGISSQRPEIMVPISELAHPAEGDEVVIDGVYYSVVSVRPDEEGTANTLMLKKS